MNKNEQKKFTRAIVKHAAESVIRDIESGKIPEAWDGIELRELLADRIKWHNMEKRRAREYRNTVLVNGL